MPQRYQFGQSNPLDISGVADAFLSARTRKYNKDMDKKLDERYAQERQDRIDREALAEDRAYDAEQRQVERQQKAYEQARTDKALDTDDERFWDESVQLDKEQRAAAAAQAKQDAADARKYQAVLRAVKAGDLASIVNDETLSPIQRGEAVEAFAGANSAQTGYGGARSTIAAKNAENEYNTKLFQNKMNSPFFGPATDAALEDQITANKLNKASLVRNSIVPFPVGTSLMLPEGEEAYNKYSRLNVSHPTPGGYVEVTDPVTGLLKSTYRSEVPSSLQVTDAPDVVSQTYAATAPAPSARTPANFGGGLGYNSSYDFMPAVTPVAPPVAPVAAVRRTPVAQPLGGFAGAVKTAADFYKNALFPPMTPEETNVMQNIYGAPVSAVNNFGAALGNMAGKVFTGRTPLMLMDPNNNMVKTELGWVNAADNIVDPRVRNPYAYRNY